MTIRDKTELLALFADNTSGDISPEDLRDFVVSNQAVTRQDVATPGTTLTPETDAALVQAADVTLPLAADYKQRKLVIKNISGGDCTINVSLGDTLDGGATLVIRDQAFIELLRSSATEWSVLQRSDIPRLLNIAFTENSTLGSNEYLQLGRVRTSATDGWLVNQNCTITAAGFTRGNSNVTGLNVMVGGAPVGNIPLGSNTAGTVPLSIPLAVGNVLAIQNDGGSNTNNVIVNLTIEV